MIAIIYENEIIGVTTEGSRYKLPNGDFISPVKAGYSKNGYRFAAILPADAVPVGKSIIGHKIELIMGEPKYINELIDEIADDEYEEISEEQYNKGIALLNEISYEDARINSNTLPTTIREILDNLDR